MKLFLSTAVLLASAVVVEAIPSAYFSASGVQDMGGAGSFGGEDNTTVSAIHELTFDFTSAVDTTTNTNSITLWEAGGSGTGSALVLQGDELFFFSSNSNSIVVSGNHGLSGGALGVQIVTLFDIDDTDANGSNELISLYVNGSLIDSGDFNTNNDWAGGENPGSGLGTIANTTRANGSPLITLPNTNYPTNDISFAVYEYEVGDNTLDNILVPVPEASTFGLLGFMAVMLLLRRRR